LLRERGYAEEEQQSQQTPATRTLAGATLNIENEFQFYQPTLITCPAPFGANYRTPA